MNTTELSDDEKTILEMNDSWLKDDGPAALVLREYLQPVEPGPNVVIFPPTFAPEQKGGRDGKSDKDGKGRKSDYHIDGDDNPEALAQKKGSVNVCIIDTIGSEANRVEPLFKSGEYRSLVPQVVIKCGDAEVNLLDAGHRAGDAIVRFSDLAEATWKGFCDLQTRGDAQALAEIAPTSLVFGVWDSRGTQVKLPRIFRSVIRAFNVRRLGSAAQFIPATDFARNTLADVAAQFEGKDGDDNPLSREGFLHASAVNTPGGVIVHGKIRREAIINLVALRSLRVCKIMDQNGTQTKSCEIDEPATLKLRRYILGLALVAGTAENPERYNLRVGCQLRQHRKRKPQWTLVPFVGDDVPLSDLNIGAAKKYAGITARAFGVKQTPISATFNRELASQWLRLDKKKQDERRRLGPMAEQADKPATGDNQGAPPSTESTTVARPARPRRRGKPHEDTSTEGS